MSRHAAIGVSPKVEGRSYRYHLSRVSGSFGPRLVKPPELNRPVPLYQGSLWGQVGASGGKMRPDLFRTDRRLLGLSRTVQV